MNTRTTLIASALLAASFISGTAHAALFDRGGGLIYDDALNVTWLKDANYGAGSIYDDGNSTTDGGMTWQNAVDWAANLSYYDSVRNVTYDDWRLPTFYDTGPLGCDFSFDNTDCGYNVDLSTGEMAHLYYGELGNVSYYDTSGMGPQTGWGLINKGPFLNFSNPATYWYGNDYTAHQNGAAVEFNFLDGGTGLATRAYTYRAWAVRDGDIAAIPEPETYAMLLAGLGLVGAMARRRKIAKV